MLLVAFRQPGCEQWDLLGGGEACDYVWDAPEAQHAVQLRAYDPSGSWHATSAPTAYSLERLELCPDLRLEPLPAPPDARHAAYLEEVLLSVACTLRFGHGPRAARPDII